MDNEIINQKSKYSLVCSSCNVAFTTNTLKKKFCTISCQKHFSRRTETKNCLQCKKKFKTKPKQLFCSRSCSVKHLHQINKEKKSLFNISDRPLPVIYPMLVLKEIAGLLRIKKAKWQKSYESKTSGNKSYKQCNHCNTNFVYMVARGCPPRYCLKCKDLVFKKHKNNFRSKKRKLGFLTDSYRKKARKYNCEYDPSVSWQKVFDRDNWICKICGIKTPKHLRNKNKPNSPELDHIIPLSKSGGHTWKNVQCSCRMCNSKKSNKIFGQLRMF